MTTLLLQSLVAAPLVAPMAMAADPPASSDQRFSVLGVQICIGEPDEGPCHLRLPAPKQPPEPEKPESKPVQLTLFGKTLCIGTVPDRSQCDLHLDGAAPGQGDADA